MHQRITPNYTNCKEKTKLLMRLTGYTNEIATQFRPDQIHSKVELSRILRIDKYQIHKSTY